MQGQRRRGAGSHEAGNCGAAKPRNATCSKKGQESGRDFMSTALSACSAVAWTSLGCYRGDGCRHTGIRDLDGEDRIPLWSALPASRQQHQLGKETTGSSLDLKIMA